MNPPPDDETLTFGTHIKPLFREGDRSSMQYAFDLWDRDDVEAHAQAILEQLEAGTMPCDGGWPADRVDIFRRWVEAGMPQ